jgi:predicted metalloprotease
MSCEQTFFSGAGTERLEEFKPLFGGGKIKICDTLRAVTP